MLNFTATLEDVISAQATGRSTIKQFLEFNSKKKLVESKLLNENVIEYIKKLKNTFTFYVHKDLRYIVITVYYSTSKTYKFLVLDTETLQVAEADSVKIAKKEVMELVAANNKAETNKATNDKANNK